MIMPDTASTARMRQSPAPARYVDQSLVTDADALELVLLLKRVLSRADAKTEGEGQEAHGRWIGMLNVSRNGLTKLKAVLAQLRTQPDFDSLDMPALLNALIADGAAIEVVYVHGHWRGVNDLEDFRSAVDFAHGQTPVGSTPAEFATT